MLQAISGQQPETQIADATNTSPAATTATLSTPQSQVMGFILCILAVSYTHLTLPTILRV